MTSDQPVVSIISFCKNRASTIRRSLDSVLNQSYRNIEFVIQDGASTDGTVDIIRSYNDPRIKLISEPDSKPAEAFWRVLNRCRGDIIGTCLSDDELVPGAIETAVRRFENLPTVGAITGDSYISDGNGKIVGEHKSADFDLVKYLFGHYCPFFPATFFRRQAFLDVGLGTEQWTIDCLEYEIWFRFGTRHEIKYLPGFVSKYAVHEKQSSHDVRDAKTSLQGWMQLFDRWFSKDGFFGLDPIKKNACIYNRLYETYNHFRAHRIAGQVEELYSEIEAFKSKVLQSYSSLEAAESRAQFSYLEQSGSAQDGLNEPGYDGSAIAVQKSFAWATEVGKRLPSALKGALSRSLKDRAKRTLAAFYLTTRSWFSSMGARERAANSPGTDPDIYGLQPLRFNSKLYNHVANLYYARGQIDHALAMWRNADNLDDSTEDNHACSANLLSPGASSESIRSLQDWWVRRHVTPLIGLPAFKAVPYRGDRRIRVGYHCSWINTPVFLAIMGAVLQAHDRGKFDWFVYSGNPEPPSKYDGMIDCFRDIGGLTDEQYVRLVRDDKIDILIEISGFSDGHRFAAMASRCAPIQVAYVNHHGTTSVPNIDYLLTDDICAPPEEERYFTERLYRLPGSFLCYNYEFEKSLPITLPPHVQNGYVTFGCFGNGAKINTELIKLWSEVLKRVENSVLLICNTQLSFRDNKKFIRERFRRFEVGEDRLRLIDGVDRERALHYLSEVSISLDTFPYSGGNTLAESFWHGVPVITLKGSRMASRYGASLVAAAGCPELIAETPEQYVAIADSLSRDHARLDYLRRNLRKMMYDHSLCDARSFARKLEAAYAQMMQRYHKVSR